MALSELVTQSRELAPHRAILDAAERTLVLARGLPYGPEQAFHELLGVATHHRIAVLTLARALIDVSETRKPDSLPADTPHTVAFEEWGELLDLSEPQAHYPDDHHPDDHASRYDDDEFAVEYLLSSDIAGRVVWVSLAFTIGAIVGIFAHDWTVLLLAVAVCTAWGALSAVRKVVQLSRTHHWSSATPPARARPNFQGHNNSRRHTISA